jgi:hypothetical protein
MQRESPESGITQGNQEFQPSQNQQQVYLHMMAPRNWAKMMKNMLGECQHSDRPVPPRAAQVLQESRDLHIKTKEQVYPKI